MKDYKITSQQIQNFMKKNFNVARNEIEYHYKASSICRTKSEADAELFKVLVRNGDFYMTIIDDSSPMQLATVNIHGESKVFEKIFEKSNIKIKKVTERSKEYINRFISRINEILLDKKFNEYNGSEQEQHINVYKISFSLAIKKIYLLNDEGGLTEKLNCNLTISNNASKRDKKYFKETIKFKFIEDYFEYGSFVSNIENVKENFLDSRIKGAFFNYNEEIIREFGIDITKKEIIKSDSEDQFEILKETIKMIRY